MKRDIETRADIYLLISEFYQKLLIDQHLKHFFEEIVRQQKLEHHLEIIVNFWEDILLNTVKYQRNAMKPHLELHQKHPFTQEHFEIWLTHFHTTIDTHFKGKTVDFAKTRAVSIATVMKIKMQRPS